MSIRTPDDEVDRPGYFTAPFREGWTYQGQTYAGHSDYSVDWNRRTPSGAWLDDTGDPVLAVADGTVTEVDKAEGLVMLEHAGGYSTEYRHMSGIVVKVGQKVERSDRLGSIGNVAGSGASFGAHLHHVHRKDGQRIKMAFEDKPVRTSVHDSDSRPEGWTPPAPVALQGPPPKMSWEDSFRASQRALAKSEAALAAQKAQTTLATDERDTARRELAAAQAALAECEAATPQDCDAAVKAERERVVDALVSGFDLLATSIR
jgi:murein DD-endopeptidase MepM/ murein hydrolase activator NlpD